MTLKTLGALTLFGAVPGLALAASNVDFAGPHIGPVPLEFIFFGCVLAGVALLPPGPAWVALSATWVMNGWS